MNVLEQIGRYGCLFLMVFNIGIAEFGFASDIGFLVYLLGNGFCLAAYLAVWLRYFKKPGLSCALALAILPTLIFLLSGITLRHWLLVGNAVLFGVGHIYVTYVNARGGRVTLLQRSGFCRAAFFICRKPSAKQPETAGSRR